MAATPVSRVPKVQVHQNVRLARRQQPHFNFPGIDRIQSITGNRIKT